MTKIFQVILVAFTSLLVNSAVAQSQNNGTQAPTVTYELIKDESPSQNKPATIGSDNPDIAQPVSKEPQSLSAPEHPGNKTREEAEKTAEGNKKLESEPKK